MKFLIFLSLKTSRVYLDGEIPLSLKKIAQECWAEKPVSRLTSLRIKKTLGKLKTSMSQSS